MKIGRLDCCSGCKTKGTGRTGGSGLCWCLESFLKMVSSECLDLEWE